MKKIEGGIKMKNSQQKDETSCVSAIPSNMLQAMQTRKCQKRPTPSRKSQPKRWQTKRRRRFFEDPQQSQKLQRDLPQKKTNKKEAIINLHYGIKWIKRHYTIMSHSGGSTIKTKITHAFKQKQKKSKSIVDKIHATTAQNPPTPDKK